MYTHTHTLFTKRAEEEGCEEREYREASDWRERGVMEGTGASYEERGRYPYDDGHENGDHRFGEREPYGSRDKSHDQDRERSRQHRDDKDRERNRSERSDKENDRERHKSREKSREPERSRDRERHRDYERERRYKHRTHSPSRGRSRGHSRSRSPSQSSSHERRSKRTSGFDMAPPGLAAVPGVTVPGAAGATQAISSVFPGMFPFMGTQFGAMSTMPMQAMTQQATRHARRVYVGGLPPQANEHMIATFFSSVMSAIGGNTAGPGDAVVNVYINHEKKFAFVEMRSVEEASNAMALDGVMFEGVSVRVRRPSDYNPSLAATLGPSQPCSHLNLAAVGLTPGSAIGGADGPDRVFVGGLPYYLTEAQIKELLESFGSLRGFDLVKDRETGNSKGYAFCVYQEPAATDVACAALNGLKMGDKTLTVRRATASGQPKPDQANVLVEAQQQIAYQKLALQTSVASPLGFPGLVSGLVAGMVPAINDDIAEVPTKVICLTQVVTADELNDDDEYQDIYDDMKQECGKFGSITNLVIPRPQVTGEPVSGVGKVFVEYSDTQGSSKAKQALHGRKFGGKPVTGVFYSEHKFHNGEYDD